MPIFEIACRAELMGSAVSQSYVKLNEAVASSCLSLSHTHHPFGVSDQAYFFPRQKRARFALWMSSSEKETEKEDTSFFPNCQLAKYRGYISKESGVITISYLSLAPPRCIAVALPRCHPISPLVTLLKASFDTAADDRSIGCNTLAPRRTNERSSYPANHIL